MTTRIQRKLIPAVLAALALAMTFLSARAHSAEAVADKVAVRPEVTSANWYGDSGYPAANPGYGSYNSNYQPYGDYSQPLTQPNYQPSYSQPAYSQPAYSQPGYGQPNGGYCPTGTCPLNNPNGQNGSYYGAGSSNWTNPQPSFPNTNYDIRLPDSQYNGGFDWRSNYGDSWDRNLQDRYPQDRYRDQSSYPNTQPFPGNNYPGNSFPGNTFPGNGYPNQTFPNQTWPNGQWPSGQYQPIPTQPRLVDDLDNINTKITARYQSPDMLGFLAKTNVNQAMNLYVEASRLIDTRHVNPASYEVRTQRALESLMHALDNPTFLRAAGATGDAGQVRALQQELAQLAQSNPPRTANEAIGVMQYASELSSRRLGVRREAVALEFFNGTLDSLDTYTAFMPSKQVYGASSSLEDMTAALEENIVGVGVELKKHDLGALVMGTVENGPAARARLTRGDVIVGIDGRSVTGMGLDQIASMISGPSGSTVSFRISRNGQEYTASMRREKVYVSSVAGVQMLDNENGYIRLKHFSESSAEDLEKAMWSMYQKGMKSLVLDLRGNPGGLLTESIQVSDLFVPEGRIVATKGRTAEDDSDERAKWEKTWRIPLVVLVDGDSASASEIFAAAIQENQRGVIVGRQTYGKGTVQTHFPLQTVSGTLKMTTAKFYSPSGREMAGEGVRPDVPVSATSDELFTDLLARDPDVQAALQVIARGIPAQLASGPTRPASGVPQLRN